MGECRKGRVALEATHVASHAAGRADCFHTFLQQKRVCLSSCSRSWGWVNHQGVCKQRPVWCNNPGIECGDPNDMFGNIHGFELDDRVFQATPLNAPLMDSGVPFPDRGGLNIYLASMEKGPSREIHKALVYQTCLSGGSRGSIGKVCRIWAALWHLPFVLLATSALD